MLLTMEMKKEIREIKSKLHNDISEKLKITPEELDKLKISQIESMVKIVPNPPHIYFAWEEGEKEGWQNSKYKVISPEEYERREKSVFSK